jgi:hypothetical protein
LEKLEDFSQKRGALWCKGHQRIITALCNPFRELWCSDKKAGSTLLQKTQEKFQKLKNSRKFSQSG